MPPTRLRVQRTSSRDMTLYSASVLDFKKVEIEHKVFESFMGAARWLNSREITGRRWTSIVTLYFAVKSLLPESVVEDLREVSPAS